MKSTLSIIVIIMMVFLAKQKGFKPWLWVLAGGIVGLIVLLFLPSARAADLDEETRQKRRKIGNMTGVIFSVIVIIIFIAWLVVLL